MNMSDAEEVVRLVEELESRKHKPLPAFLGADDVVTLTGRKIKRLQVEALRNMGIPFFVNAIGRPVVARTVVEGKAAAAPQEKPAWQPPGLRKK
ncbi:DUF4224 domain-containing protein [Janthinobacterium sp. DSP2-3-3]|uniref:DUF4224 domain-containing protein n=1 Tax=unclassified Janthinobacterium TaxID=2610881 RepID=UPI003CF6330E